VTSEASAQNRPAGFSPLSAGLHGQHSRSSLVSPRSSRDSLLDSEQQPYQQQQQQQLQQPGAQLQQQQLSSSQRHQQDAEQLQQQQQQVHGLAYISVTGRGNEGSPRSPSRLRYVRKDSASAAAAAAIAPQLPDFLQVQELPPGVLHEVCADRLLHTVPGPSLDGLKHKGKHKTCHSPETAGTLSLHSMACSSQPAAGLTFLQSSHLGA
jgi:hypothetical protein